MPKTAGELFAKVLSQEELACAKYALVSQRRKHDLGDTFRRYKTSPLEYRTEFHRDRDRIIWSRAFKRLQHKTQIFPHYVEDHYRRRLTHTLEVAQIATTLARALKANEVATEAIALGHDLGHAPFGHAGEEALNERLKNSKPKKGGAGKLKGRRTSSRCPVPLYEFDHCAHGVEIVSRIEDEYRRRQAGTFGLNLTFDVVDGILKHIYDPDAMPGRGAKVAAKLPGLVKHAAYKDYGDNKGSIEAQCVYLADKTAYLLGDIEDAIGRRIFLCNELEEDEFIKYLWDRYTTLRNTTGKVILKDSRDFLELRGAALTVLILDAVEHSQALIKKARPASVPEVLECSTRLVAVPDKTCQLWDRFYKKWCEGTLYRNTSPICNTDA